MSGRLITLDFYLFFGAENSVLTIELYAVFRQINNDTICSIPK